LVVFRKNKGDKKAHPVMQQPKGVSKNKIAQIPSGTHLTREELNKKLKDRQVRVADLATAQEIQEGDARLVSLNPSDKELDNIVVAKDSPIIEHEADLVKNPKLREKELKTIMESEDK
jgi:hypothetical protein